MGSRGEVKIGFALGLKEPHRIDRFAHALKNSNVPLTTSIRGDSPGFLLLLCGRWNQAGFAALFEPVTLTANVHRSRMVQQAIEDCRGDNWVAEDRAPFAVAFIGSQN